MTADPRAPKRRAAAVFVFVTVLIDVLSFGIIIPVLPQLMEHLAHGGIAEAAVWVGVLSAMFAVIQFLSSPVQGALSDRYGRRPVILLSNLGLGIDFLVMALAPTLWLLFVGRAISAVASASFTTANAYVADVTPRERRAAAFGMIGAAFGVGFVVGPALGGLLGGLDLRLPFWVAAGLSLVNFCYGLFVLPESLAPERRSRRLDWRRANPLGALRLLARHPEVLGLAVVLLLSQLAHYVLQSTFVLYTDYRYGWGPSAVGYTLAVVGVSSGLVQGVLIRRLVPALGERRALFAGLAFGIAALIGMGWAPVAPAFLATIPLMALWGLAGPPAQALMSARVGPEEQGRLQGAVSSLNSLAGIFGPLLFTNVFALSIAQTPARVPGLAFYLAAAILLIGAVIAWRAAKGRKSEDASGQYT